MFFFFIIKKKLLANFFFFFFFAFLKSVLTFEHFQTKLNFIADGFPNYGLRKPMPDNCLKSPVLEDPLASNI